MSYSYGNSRSIGSDGSTGITRSSGQKLRSCEDTGSAMRDKRRGSDKGIRSSKDIRCGGDFNSGR